LLTCLICSCVSLRDGLYKKAATGVEKTVTQAVVPEGARGAVVKAAVSQLDKYYSYGSQDKYQGFDCSGLAQYSYNEAGIKIPRTVKLQYDSAQKIQKGELKPADLVFFTTYAPGATHVGIYIGNGKFIHAPTTGKKVDISELKNVYWEKAFITGGRYIKDQ
jgi:cell wall-associated NlpC family hydrolase